MNAKHTPRPWTARSLAIYGPKGELIAHVGGTLHPIGSRVPEQEANARVMAASPKLLAAAKETLDYFETVSFCPCQGVCECIVSSLRAAIATAGGGA